MKETDVLGQLKELPPIIIDNDELQNIPKHKRVNHVLTNYLKGGDTIAKTSLMKYFVNSVVGVVETINTNPVLKLYLNILKSGMSIFELNTIFNNIVRPVSNNRHSPSRRDVLKSVIIDNFGDENKLIHYFSISGEYDILKDYIFDISEKTCIENNIEILLRDSQSTEFTSRKIIIIKYDGDVIILDEEKYMLYTESVTESSFGLMYNRDEEDECTSRSSSALHKLNNLAMKIFFEKINPVINYVVIDNDGYHIREKNIVEEKVININYDQVIKSMEYCISNGMKRGYMFIGCPGVGKSLTIHKIANHFKEIPTFIIKNEKLTSADDIKRAFDMVRPFKSIMVIDDFDGLDVEGKNYITNEFLYQMDINGGYCGIIIAAVNDPSKVNYTLVNRPGRFDEVHLMKIPENEKEVSYILASRLKKSGISLESLLLNEDDVVHYNELITLCIDNKFTHARISGIVEYALCHFDEITISNLIPSAMALIEFSENAKMSFNGSELVRSNAVERNNTKQWSIKRIPVPGRAMKQDDDYSDEVSEEIEEPKSTNGYRR